MTRSPLAVLVLAGCGIGLTDYGRDSGDTADTALTDTQDTGPVDLGGTGTSGLIELTLLQVACPACFDATTDLFVDARAAFHAPTSGSWIAWMPAMGTCSLTATPTPLASATRDLGSWVYLQSGSKNMPLQRTSGQLGTIYQSNGATESDYLRNASWDVVAPDAPGGALSITGGLHSTEGFDSLQPQTMLYVDPTAAFAAPIARQGQTFTWSPVASGDFFVVLVDAYDPNTAAYLGSATCRGADSGSLNVPAGMLTAFPPYALLGIGLYRYRYNIADVEDGSVLESVSSFGVLGTGTLVP